jgi:hypothetical protein
MSIANAKLSFADLIVDDDEGRVMLPFQRVEPLVLQLDDSDQGLGKYMFDLQWPPNAKQWCDEVKRVPCDDLWQVSMVSSPPEDCSAGAGCCDHSTT